VILKKQKLTAYLSLDFLSGIQPTLEREREGGGVVRRRAGKRLTSSVMSQDSEQTAMSRVPTCLHCRHICHTVHPVCVCVCVCVCAYRLFIAVRVRESKVVLLH